MGTVVSFTFKQGSLADLSVQMHPPMQDMVTLTAMLYRFCAAWNV